MLSNFKSIFSLGSYLKSVYGTVKPKKFLTRQLDDINLFGIKKYHDRNTPAEIIEKFTPFRRLSKKQCKLSDPKYFITRFENENPGEIPKLWDRMSNEQKVDFIVKNRYERLVSNKIMNTIKNSRVEQEFGITTNGQIRYYGTFNSSRHCPVPSDNTLITIHNHPLQFGSQYSKIEYDAINKDSHPFSGGDLLNAIMRPKSYVVDMHGNKYCFVPNKKLQNPYTIDNYITILADDLADITAKNMNKYSNIASAMKYARIDYIKRVRQDGHIFKHLNLFNSW